MSKQYCPKSQRLPRAIYYRVLYMIKDYPRMLADADALLASTPDPTETPEIQRQRNLRATETQNIRYAEIMKTVREIETALRETVPQDCREAILQSVISNKPYPLKYSRSTYSKYKQKFIEAVARKEKLI